MRALSRVDVPALLQIENKVHTLPWAREIFLTCFDMGCYGFGIEIEGKLAAFLMLSIKMDECHILNVAVDPNHQRQGYGEALMRHALSQGKAQGASIVYLEVRRSNQKAITLYRKMGLLEIGERKDYYPEPSGCEDALIFAKPLKMDSWEGN